MAKVKTTYFADWDSANRYVKRKYHASLSHREATLVGDNYVIYGYYGECDCGYCHCIDIETSGGAKETVKVCASCYEEYT